MTEWSLGLQRSEIGRWANIIIAFALSTHIKRMRTIKPEPGLSGSPRSTRSVTADPKRAGKGLWGRPCERVCCDWHNSPYKLPGFPLFIVSIWVNTVYVAWAVSWLLFGRNVSWWHLHKPENQLLLLAKFTKSLGVSLKRSLIKTSKHTHFQLVGNPLPKPQGSITKRWKICPAFL